MLRNRVELVLVAAGTRDGERHEAAAEGVHSVVDRLALRLGDAVRIAAVGVVGRSQGEKAGRDRVSLIPDQVAGDPQLQLPQQDNSALEEMINVSSVEGHVRATSMKRVVELVENHPEETVAILRNWMFQET